MRFRFTIHDSLAFPKDLSRAATQFVQGCQDSLFRRTIPGIQRHRRRRLFDGPARLIDLQFDLGAQSPR